MKKTRIERIESHFYKQEDKTQLISHSDSCGIDEWYYTVFFNFNPADKVIKELILVSAPGYIITTALRALGVS